MRLNKTSEYAIRVLSYMAVRKQQLYTAKELSQRLEVPQKYFRKLMTDLTKKGFIKSIQGREGGYTFARPTNEIFLSEIIEAVEGMDKYMGCILGLEFCSDKHPCLLHEMWKESREKLLTVFHLTTIGKLTANDLSRF